MQQEYPLGRMHYPFCPTARYVGGTSHYLCGCISVCKAAQAAKMDAREPLHHLGHSVGIYITNELYDAIENALTTWRATVYAWKQFEGMFESPIILPPGPALVEKIVETIRCETPGNFLIGDTHTYVIVRFD